MRTRRGLQPKSLTFASESEFLSIRHLPRRLGAWQTAALGGFETAHIPILVTSTLLRPLGNPPPNAPKYFAREYVMRLFANRNRRKRTKRNRSTGRQK